MSCHPYHDFSIDGHNMTIIEADGDNTEALPDIDQIRIYPAQRYSFVVSIQSLVLPRLRSCLCVFQKLA